MRWVLLICCILLSACGDSGSNETSNFSQENNRLLLDSTHGGNGYAWGQADCSNCHAMGVMHKGEPKIQALVQNKGYATCTGCHGRNGTTESEPQRCVICHNTADLPVTPRQQGAHSHGFIAGAAGALADSTCLACHAASDMDGVFELDHDLTRLPDAAQMLTPYGSTTDFCLRCHNRDHQQAGFEITGHDYNSPLIAIEDSYRYVDQHGKPEGSGERTYAGLREGYTYRTTVLCTDCHALHGTNNAKLIIDNSLKGVTKLAPAIRQPAHTVDTRGGDLSQLCVLCHRMDVILDAGDQDTGNGLSGVHETGSDCLPCHTHGESVQAGL